MKLTLGLNISAMKAQRQLNNGSNDLSSVFERLASGQRINRASDDAAGLAIADSLNADVRVYNQGIRNLNDGISLLNIADSALSELTNITVRLTELAEQAANGTLGSAQRRSLDEEAQALKAEYFRITKSTTFNDRILFDGAFGELHLQAGYGADGILSADLGGAIGDGTFRDGVTYAADSDVATLATADLNGDGFIDLVSANQNSNSLTVFIGNGNGTFQAATTLQYAGGQPQDVELSDINNDGIIDVIAVDRTGSIGTYIGAGDGTFGGVVSMSLGATLHEVEVADFNGDGYMDVAVGVDAGAQLQILLGNGSGAFTAVATVSSGGQITDLAVGDFNNDGVWDLVSTSATDTNTRVYLGTGDGSFGAGTDIATRISRGISIADINGDGNDDIITTQRNANGYLVTYVGDGQGGFTEYDSVDIHPNSENTQVIDIDGDGFLDIAVLLRSSNQIRIYNGAADGTFSYSGVTYATGTDPTSLVKADLNGDGVEDLISANSDSGTISAFIANTTSGVAPLLDFSLENVTDAKQALSVFKKKTESLSIQRGEIGAFQSRINVAINVLQNSAENYRAAESRIRDADIAQEAAELARLQILQQAATAVLGQANQQPQLVLQLLRNIN